jgi:predicted enzyme related to lactoylglutathione lyase
MSEVPDWARPVVYWEIEARDAERQREFYRGLFQWDVGEGQIMSIPPGLGGPDSGIGGHIRASDRSRINLYVQVRDLAESLSRVEALGGTVIMPRLDVPNGATLAVIADPEDNQLVLVQQ